MISLDSIIDYSEERIKLLSSVENPCFSSKLAASISSMIHKLAGDIKPLDSEIAMQHNYYSLVNILYDGQKIAVLDYTSSETGLIYNDLARFWGGLDCIKNSSWQRKHIFENLQKVFLAEYGAEFEVDYPPFLLCRIKYALANILSVHRVIRQKNRPVRLSDRYWYSKFYKYQLSWLKNVVEYGVS